ncbi:MAG: hypothetical protein J6N20_09590 [Pseudomonas sp.]|nr:hypothetical protein [Pseudomonas sp.]
MTAQRLPNGDTLYRVCVIQLNPRTNPGKLGRYSVDGVPFSQLATAKEYIDVLAKQKLIERDTCI